MITLPNLSVTYSIGKDVEYILGRHHVKLLVIMIMGTFLVGCFASVSYENGQLSGQVGGTLDGGDSGGNPSPGSTPNYSNGEIIQTGMASWYGGKFHGRETASGEIYDKWAMTAAHRTLPLGTRLVVERVSNGKAVEVKVNDRGPYRKGRIIDLSRGAAEQIGMVEDGVAKVRLYKVGGSGGEVGSEKSGVAESTPTTEAGKFSIQVGSFREESNALDLKAQLAGRVDGVHISMSYDELYRVRVGGYQTRAEAEVAEEGLQRLGFETWIVREGE